MSTAELKQASGMNKLPENWSFISEQKKNSASEKAVSVCVFLLPLSFL